MAVMAVAIAGGIFGIGFWLWRRRRNQKGAIAGTTEGTYVEHKEMPVEVRPQTLHELNAQHHSELDGKPHGWLTQAEVEKDPSKTYELPGDTTRRDGL